MENTYLTFGFIEEHQLRVVLEDYYRQTRSAASADSHLGVIVGCGSVVEGLLTWALLQRQQDALKSGKSPKDKQGSVRPIRDWGLAQLIDVASDLGLVGKTARQASWALKDFRNFIHPYNVLLQSARL